MLKKIFGHRLTKEFWTEKIFIPLVLIFVTAVAGQWIGRSLQAQKFKKEKLFELKMEALKEGRKKATEIKLDSRRVSRKISSVERNRKRYWNSSDEYTKEDVRKYKWDNEELDIIQIEGKLNDLKGITKIVDKNNRISTAADKATKTIGGLINCLRDTPNSHSCSEQFKDSIFVRFERLETSFNSVIQDIVENENVK